MNLLHWIAFINLPVVEGRLPHWSTKIFNVSLVINLLFVHASYIVFIIFFRGLGHLWSHIWRNWSDRLNKFFVSDFLITIHIQPPNNSISLRWLNLVAHSSQKPFDGSRVDVTSSVHIYHLEDVMQPSFFHRVKFKLKML